MDTMNITANKIRKLTIGDHKTGMHYAIGGRVLVKNEDRELVGEAEISYIEFDQTAFEKYNTQRFFIYVRLDGQNTIWKVVVDQPVTIEYDLALILE